MYSPVITNADPSVLASNAGIYTKMLGYDRIETNGHSLIWAFNAHREPPEFELEIWPRENGRFSPSNSQIVELTFTNISGSDIIALRQTAGNGAYIWQELYATKYTSSIPSAAWIAWSNRMDSIWLVRDFTPDDWLQQFGVSAQAGFFSKDGCLLAYDFSGKQMVLEPVNDTLAFVHGLNPRCGSAVRVFTNTQPESFQFSGFHFDRADQLPALAEDAATNGVLTSEFDSAAFRVCFAGDGVYDALLTEAPETFDLTLFNLWGAPLDSVAQSNLLTHRAEYGGDYYLQVRPRLQGAWTGAFNLALSYPLIIRDMEMTNQSISLSWQSRTGTTYAVYAATSLGPATEFNPVRTNIPADGIRTLITNLPPQEEIFFYRVENE